MLYNKNWDAKTITSDPFTLDHFVSWLETKAPEQSYNFHNCGGLCLAGQYMKEHGRVWNNSNYLETCEQLFGSALDVPVLIIKPHTFGAALERSREVAAR